MNVVVFNLMLLIVCGYALIWGGAPERITALVFAGASGLTYAFMYDYGFGSISLRYFLLDVSMLVVIGGLSLWADRFWPMWVAATQFVIVAVHVAKAYRPELLPFVYYAATAKLAYPMVLMVAVGTLRHRERVARHGAELDWSRWHDRSSETRASD